MPKGVYVRKPFSKKHCRNIKQGLLGTKQTFTTIEKRRKALIKRKLLFVCPQCRCTKYLLPSEIKHKIYCSRKCSYAAGQSEKTKEIIRGRALEQFKDGMPQKTKDKISKASLGKNIGEKNGMWQNGISKELYGTAFTTILRKTIRQRDNYVCQLCKSKWHQKLKTFAIHHIDYNKKNCSSINLITLCNRCHAKTNFNRDYWSKYFSIINNTLTI